MKTIDLQRNILQLDYNNFIDIPIKPVKQRLCELGFSKRLIL